MSPELDTFKRYQGGAIQGAWSGCFQGYRGDAMQDLGYELPRIPIPRTPLNRRPVGPKCVRWGADVARSV
jgi:hypothetical protein